MKLICCNFKMNLLKNDIDNYLNIIKDKIEKERVIFFPSIPYIESFSKENYLVGSQNISFTEFGSVTGDTSIKQLKELGITYTIIGHSERRKYFDDDKYISKKIKLALNNNIKVILCIGELEKISREETNSFLKDEIDEALRDNLDLINDNIIIAYEPIWAIGSGVIPDNNWINTTTSYIKNYIKNTYNKDIKVLYGGSVKVDNIDNLEKLDIIDGYLIGGASLNPNDIIALQSKIK